jgi:chromosome segregation ATPase
VDVVDAETQTTELDGLKRDPQPHVKYENEEEWQRDLRQHLVVAQEERDEIQRKLNLRQLDLDNCTRQLSESRSKVDELHTQLDQAKAELRALKAEGASRTQIQPSESSIIAESLRRRPLSGLGDDDPLKVELRDCGIQVVPYRTHLVVSTKPDVFESKPLLLRYYHHEDEVLSPSPQEQEIFDAKNNAFSVELAKLHEVVSKQDHSLDEVNQKLLQRDQMIIEYQKTINKLEQHLNEQRVAFQEKITEMNEQAEQIIEARVKEAQDMDTVMKVRPLGAMSSDELAEVSLRLQRLNRDKNALELELRDAKESGKVLHRQNDVLRKRVEELEAGEMVAVQERSTRQDQLGKYTADLRRKLKDMQDKYADLERTFDGLQKKYQAVVDRQGDRPPKSDRLAGTVDSEGDTGSLKGADEDARLRSAQVRFERVKVQNEELQLRLSKANATMERLNQLVQRKEAQLSQLQEQLAQAKAQLASKGTQPGSARSRRP